MKVLIVDDYNTMRRIVRNLLSRIGLEDVDEAEDGASALSWLRQVRSDLVILDINMMPVTGLDVLNAMRDDATLKDIPVLMMVPEGRQDLSDASSHAGASGVLVKPFNTKRLQEAISSLSTSDRISS